MSRTVRLIHRQQYTFALERYDAVAAIRLCPLDRGPRQRLLHHQLVASPGSCLEMHGHDAQGNGVVELMWETLPELSIASMSAVELTSGGTRLEDLAPAPFRASTALAPIDPTFEAIGSSVFETRQVDASRLFQFAKLMRSCLRYETRWTRATRSAGGALRSGVGAHADYAHIALAVLRSLGFAACYVSGYLLPAAGAGEVKAHAWIAVHTATHGWLEVDPTLGCPPDLRHVALNVGRDAADVFPVESHSLTGSLSRVRRTITCYPLTRTSIPAARVEALAS